MVLSIVKSKIDLTSAVCFPDPLVLLLPHRLLPAAQHRRGIAVNEFEIASTDVVFRMHRRATAMPFEIGSFT
jgi:hypothetical protein